MKIEELKIGNKILFGVVECTINSIHKVVDSPNNEWHVRVFGIGNFNQYCLNGYEIEPIELNEDVLKKCSRKIEECFYFGSWNGVNLKFKSQWCIGINDSKGEFREVKHGVKYLHELQNLYYSLTNEELTFI